MTISAPIYLLALLAIPLVAAAYAVARRRRRRFAVRFPAAGLFASIRQPKFMQPRPATETSSEPILRVSIFPS